MGKKIQNDELEQEKMSTSDVENLEVENDIKDNVTNSEGINKDEYIAKLNEDLRIQKERADEYFDSLKRNMAEFDNFKKRIMKEKTTMYTSVISDVFADLLPVLDNFNQAMENKCEDESFKEGMQMIKTQFEDTLKKLGLEEIEAESKTFDPAFHDAVMHIEDENYSEGQIVEVLRRGYKYQDRVIRHTMVKVAN